MKKILVVLLLILFMSSCHSSVKESDTDIVTENDVIPETPVSDTDVVTEKDVIPETQVSSTTVENSVSEPFLGEIVETKHGLAYKSDIETYGSSIAATYYKWRMNGNPDLLSTDCIPYGNNEAGFSIVPLQTVYSLQDTRAQWGVDVVSISDDLKVINYSEALNLDKKVNGEWVRQTILDIDSLTHEEGKTASDYLHPKETILKSIFVMNIDKVDPKIEAGEYRFIFYVLVEVDGEREFRKYHIPFEVTE